MAKGYFTKNALVINENSRFTGCLKVTVERVESVYEGIVSDEFRPEMQLELHR